MYNCNVILPIRTTGGAKPTKQEAKQEASRQTLEKLKVSFGSQGTRDNVRTDSVPFETDVDYNYCTQL